MRERHGVATLFVVARNRPELFDHLRREFPGGDVAVVLDRREGERRQGERRGRRPAQVAGRRRGDRRKQTGVARELASMGYAIVHSDDAQGDGGGWLVNRTAIRQAGAYLMDRFRYYTAVGTWDARRNGHAFVLLNGAASPRHRVVFDREFLDYYGRTAPERIPSVLDEWKLSSQLETAGSSVVRVSPYGVEVVGR